MRTESSMSRRKKRSTEPYLSSTMAEVRDPSRPAGSAADPPRPNKPLLVASITLLVAWILFLVVLAIMS